jgi:hypothetical protein
MGAAMEAGAMEAEAMEAGAIARNSDKLKANGCCVADPSAVARCWAMFPRYNRITRHFFVDIGVPAEKEVIQ